MNEKILSLIRKAGIRYNEDYIDKWEKIKGRGFIANYEALEKFAKLIGQEVRDHERKRTQTQSEAQETGKAATRPINAGSDRET